MQKITKTTMAIFEEEKFLVVIQNAIVYKKMILRVITHKTFAFTNFVKE